MQRNWMVWTVVGLALWACDPGGGSDNGSGEPASTSSSAASSSSSGLTSSSAVLASSSSGATDSSRSDPSSSSGATDSSRSDPSSSSAAVASSSSAPSSSSSSGCVDAGVDCPVPGNPCVLATCVDGACGTANVPESTPVAQGQVAGDCQRLECNGVGDTRQAPDDTDIPDDQQECTVDACASGQPTHQPAPTGSACSSNGGQVCSPAGTCVECLADPDCLVMDPSGLLVCDPVGGSSKCVPSTCQDGHWGGQETSQDCGGPECAPCPDGAACNHRTDCSSGVCTELKTCAACAGDGECDAAAWCHQGVCQPDLAQGTVCTRLEQCASGSCVDGVCCSGTCAGGCMACSAAKKGDGADGTCGPVAAGTDPDTECPEQDMATCGSMGFCNGSGACAVHPQGTPCLSASCAAGSQTATSTCDGLGVCVPGAIQACGAYVCDASGTACRDTCAADPECASGHFCASGTCLPLQLVGAPCTGPNQCHSNACADGVCCTTACTGTCESCNPVDNVGTCTVYAAGTDPEGECAGSSLCTGGPACSVCGNSAVEPGELCDDGNTTPGDGCAADCTVEMGYTCPPAGGACHHVPFCGDGAVDLDQGEQCDDGNTLSGDGCTSLCQLEPNFVCPSPGQPCVSTVVCGDGKLTGTETCDDGNRVSGDGCAATCQREAGWVCSPPGRTCFAARCGDGIRAGTEPCDDGNTVSNDGCSASCVLEPGFACVQSGTRSVCHATHCGDGVKEGFEECDDSNLIPLDGCSATCTVEPSCAGGACTAVCGDGLKFPQEQCDDGNLVAGDGCSPTCTMEPGWTCNAVNQPPPASLVVPVLYRDFLYSGTTVPGSGHADFESFTSTVAQTGLVNPQLGADGKPVWRSNTSTSGTTQLTGAINFCWWFHGSGCNGAGSVNPYAKMVYLDATARPTTLLLNQISSNVYQYRNYNFFPVDGLGWNAGPSPQTSAACGDTHNYSFTTETHVPFTYQASASPTVNITSEDDAWVFINGHLAVDLGGVHGPVSGSITLTAANATTLGLTNGGMYSLDVFQAQRRTCGSSVTLTLSGFTHTVSQCSPICGDGAVNGTEVCDDGVNNGAWGGCLPGCLGRAGYCGDVLTQAPAEECDSGPSSTVYGGALRVCGPACRFAPYCGDGVASNGEQCDEGAANGSGYGHCGASCTLGPRCGDGELQPAAGESCDDGINNGSQGSGCDAQCHLK